MSPFLDHFALIAPHYDRIFRLRSVAALMRRVAPDSTDRLLDVGGGTGRVAQHFVAHVRQVCVLDSSASMLRQGRRKNLCIIRGEAERIPFGDDTFERVMMVDTFHHLRDQRVAVHELMRVLRPGGRLVIEEPDIAHWGVKLVAWGEKLALMRSHFYPAAAIRALCEQAGGRAYVERDNYTVWVVVEKI